MAEAAHLLEQLAAPIDKPSHSLVSELGTFLHGKIGSPEFDRFRLLAALAGLEAVERTLSDEEAK